MNDAQPVIDPKDRNCTKCVFCVHVRPDPKILQTQPVCYRLPPVPVAFPIGPGKFNVNMMRPIVSERDWCFEFSPIESAPSAMLPPP